MLEPAAATVFESHRARLHAIAYRMLGSATEAEDIVQEAYLRYHATPPETVRAPAAFLNTVVTRLCLNHLDSARAKREAYVGLWLPEPVRTGEGTTLGSSPPVPAQHAELRESLSLAFLALLEQLTPLERAVFLLRAVFDYTYAEIAAIVERDEAACRQIFSRARKHIAAHRPRFQATPQEHRLLLGQFVEAVSTGHVDGLLHLLAGDVTLRVDGGGKVRGAATRALHGARPVARFILTSTRYLAPGYRAEIAEVNGGPAAILRAGSRVVLLIVLGVDGGQIREIDVIGNPDKLRGLETPGAASS